MATKIFTVTQITAVEILQVYILLKGSPLQLTKLLRWPLVSDK